MTVFARAAAAVLVSSLCAQEGVPAPAGLVPEQMWPAPTAEDWQKPVLIQWQRTWQDAVRLSQETKKPLLVCVNMDGEIASEHYAGIRYRDPEVAKLFEPYVCVMASVYRHTPSDYDAAGRRIVCPRLGCVTCGEHMALEPLVFQKFLDGKRISPRHIMVELDGSESYDVFYTWDVASVLTTLKDGIEKRAVQALPVVKGDRSLLEKLASADSADRDSVELAFAAAKLEQRQAMLEAAVKLGADAPIELLRQAAFGLDPALAERARAGMLAARDPGAAELLMDTLQVPVSAQERQQLAAALQKFASTNQRARILAHAHQGLTGNSDLNLQQWQQSMAQGEFQQLAQSYDAAAKASASEAALAKAPASPAALLDLAEASLMQALQTQALSGKGGSRQAERIRECLLLDAERLLARAGQATDWRVQGIAALLHRERGQLAAAYAAAIHAAPKLPTDAPGLLAMQLLALFAEARQEAIVAAVRSKSDWPSDWMTDVHAAYAVLAKHPLGTDAQVAHHYDFLQFFASPETPNVLEAGLERFPLSALLHERLRAHLLRTAGVPGLLRDYERRVAAADCPPELHWYASHAARLAGEQLRRRNRADEALAAYQQAITQAQHYRDRSQQADAALMLALAHGGHARVLLTQGNLESCFAALQAMFAADPVAAAHVDGLSVTGMQTAEMLKGKLLAQKNEALLSKLDATLKQLPSEAFTLPDYEQASRGQGRPRRGG